MQERLAEVNNAIEDLLMLLLFMLLLAAVIEAAGLNSIDEFMEAFCE